ncbi:hypothetical protein JYU15_02320, partial [bacterium AH-315-I18]|nr:hypothetical protein [bacterium AH-315-I18]
MQKINVKIALPLVVLTIFCATTWAQQINVQVSAKPNPDITVPQPAPAKTSKIKQVNADNKSQIFFPALKDDLVNTGSATLASIKHDDYKNFLACRTKAINDGKVGTPSKQPSIIFDLDGVWTTTFTLNTKK